MKIKCEYCGAFISDTDEKCSNCGAVNSHLQRNSNQAPRTIEELKQWYINHNLPDENTTRFFIGKNYQNPRAFGIYKDETTGNFVVYKNKDTGERAIRYEGKDEAYAVNELYIKLKEEIINQKKNNVERMTKRSGYYARKSEYKTIIIAVVILFLILFISGLISSFTPKRGYYTYGRNYYYYQSGTWYGYNDNTGWYKTHVPDDLESNYSDYYDSRSYDSYYGINRFEDSDYYIAPSSSSSDWDSSSSWSSSDSWDSGSTDWSSDW